MKSVSAEKMFNPVNQGVLLKQVLSALIVLNSKIQRSPPPLACLKPSPVQIRTSKIATAVYIVVFYDFLSSDNIISFFLQHIVLPLVIVSIISVGFCAACNYILVNVVQLGVM